jgi:hypothetical protein
VVDPGLTADLLEAAVRIAERDPLAVRRPCRSVFLADLVRGDSGRAAGVDLPEVRAVRPDTPDLERLLVELPHEDDQ